MSLYLAIKTDAKDSELYLLNDTKIMGKIIWSAHRELAETIHRKIDLLLTKNNLNLSDAKGIAIYKGPGSFTGLRIGISVANSLADGLRIPIIGTAGKDWLANGAKLLIEGENKKIVLPEYGLEPKTTKSVK